MKVVLFSLVPTFKKLESWLRCSTHTKLPYPEANASSLARVEAALALFNGTASPMVPPLDDINGDLVAATGAAFVRYLPSAQFAGMEVDNEPDLSNFKGNYTGYIATLNIWLSALEAAGVLLMRLFLGRRRGGRTCPRF